MNQKLLTLSVVSQERELLHSTQVEKIIAPTTTGQITILPRHIPLLTELATGELTYTSQQQEHSLVISKGFLDKDIDNQVVIMVDTAKLAREISLQKAEQAVQKAQQTMEQTTDRRELLLAEASLKQALWEMKVAQKTRKTKI